jgi:hypothetical protein
LWLGSLLCRSFSRFVPGDVVGGGVSSDYVDSFGPKLAIQFAGIGGLCGLVFWGTGIFRNGAFPFVPTSLPLTLGLIVPIAIGGYFAFRLPLFEYTPFTGRVVGIAMEPPQNSKAGLAQVRLKQGAIVEAEFSDDRPGSMIVGHCWHVAQHWSTRERHRIYTLSSPFPEGFDDCWASPGRRGVFDDATAWRQRLRLVSDREQ